METSTLTDAVRVVLLLLTVPVAILVVKFGHAGWRDRRIRTWGAAAIILLLAVPTRFLLLFEKPLDWVPVILYALALFCAIVALMKMYTIHPEWTRVRLAAERRAEGDRLDAQREEQDDLRAGDRVSQAGERADSRDMYDAGHLDESNATYDRRVEAREAQDANREHSHQLQDDERQAVRDEEDDRLR